MKISNWCCVAGMIIIVSCVSWGMKYQMLQKLSYTRFCYNQITDNALEDGLKAGTADDDSAVPYVNENLAVQTFKESLLKGFDLDRDSSGGRKVLDCIGCIIILQNEYFSVITEEGSVQYPYQADYGKWRIQFAMDGNVKCKNKQTQITVSGTEETIRNLVGYNKENEETSWKTSVITECVEEKMEQAIREKWNVEKYLIDFPQIREEGYHTLEGISMLSFMQYGEYRIDGLCCNRFVLSGARLSMDK